MADFTMPALGADMETGQVVQWLVKPGDRVRSGDVIAVVETQKGAIDVECFLDGVIDDLVALGKELPVGAVLAQVCAEGEAPVAPTQLPTAGPQTLPLPATAPAHAASAPVAAVIASPRTPVSPAARRRARELALDPQVLHGTGVGGAVNLADVELAASPPGPVPVPAGSDTSPRRGFDLAQMRLAIATAMARSKREIPHYYLTSTIDFAPAAAWLDAYNRDRDPADRLLPATLLLKATALALAGVPQLNGRWENDTFHPGAGIHIGWAIALRGGGLVAPAIHDVDRLPLPVLMVALRDLVQRARGGRLRSSELTDPTVTVTSLGERGAESVIGVIYPPQVAIVGFGRVARRPWVIDGEVVARPLVVATLAADHRASDGHLGGQLLAAIDRALQAPDTL
ncbi:MAG: dihydrolipoamide acetyltransferase family protein [Pseudomonadota bacterium]|nr:dihydrolipoamide acetyltransferase family protein [Pseudomonadota bacterium]